jgi:hypothetical protein
MNRRPGFFHGVMAAAALALLGSALILVLSPFLGLATVIRLATPFLALAYLLYLLRAARARTGRVVTLSAWGIMSLAAWWFAPSLPFYLLLHAGAIWLIRSLYVYSGLFPALIDLALTAGSVLAFSWAFMRTGSVFLATWCFFLAQALWAYIPLKVQGRNSTTPQIPDNSRFDRARRHADAALRQLFSQ